MTKSTEAMIEFQEQKLKMINFQFSQNFQIQDPYSIFQIPQQEEKLMDSDRSWKTWFCLKIIFPNLSVG